MSDSTSKNQINSINRDLWPLYVLNGVQSIAFGSFIVLVVPLSLLMWPGDDYHALEIGILITILFWSGSFCGLLFGRLVDKFSRIKIIFFLSIFRGIPMIMLGFAIPGLGIQTWGYFIAWVFVFGCFSGGMYPSVVSLSNDKVPREIRSRFFGYYEIVRNLSTVFGFLIASFLVQVGLWRQLFWGIGILILIFGIFTFIHVEEPKRGMMREELTLVLQDESIKYDFQIDKKMMKKTMLSNTNKVALIEGISTMILMGSINILILPYIQTEPHNIAPFTTAVFMVVFGLTGGLLGTLLLARLCDKIAKEHPVRRLPIIVFAITGGLLTFALFFFLPWPRLTVEQGKDVAYLMTRPSIYIMGAMFFMSRAIFSLYMVNQVPVLQEINLPEAQGQIISWNQFLESLGRGIGPLLTGILLFFTVNNYQLVALVLILFILPGITLWLMALKWFPEDRQNIKIILEERAKILKDRQNSTSTPTSRLLKP